MTPDQVRWCPSCADNSVQLRTADPQRGRTCLRTCPGCGRIWGLYAGSAMDRIVQLFKAKPA